MLVSAGCASVVREAYEASGYVIVGSLAMLVDNSYENVDLTLRLARALKEKDRDTLEELLGNDGFLSAGMNKDEYIELLLQTNRMLIIETDSMRVDLFHGKDQMGTVSVVLPPEAADSLGAIHGRQDGDSTAFSMWSPEIDTLSQSFDQPTRAAVHVFMLVVDSDTARIDNSIFSEKDKERWLITSFKKDLLQLAGVRTDSGKE